MSLITELREAGLLENPDNLKPTGEKLTVFERVRQDIAHGDVGRQVDTAIRKQAEGWSAMAHQVVGNEHF